MLAVMSGADLFHLVYFSLGGISHLAGRSEIFHVGGLWRESGMVARRGEVEPDGQVHICVVLYLVCNMYLSLSLSIYIYIYV